ncbi:hypothetical protein ACFYNO_17460 [Kitasatospora sp. NPDC006697]|uniref:terpene synthase family protein n=1 Tax=Kitasatospora sp. NPDC006697 TaxID=3364020 RepID=UPI0036B0462D
MPQDLPFDVPFPYRTSPDAAGTRARSLAWCRRRGLLTGAVDELRAARWDIPGLMARWCPLAEGAALDLASEAVLVATMLDDQIDGPLADRPDRVRELCAGFNRVLHGSGDGTVPDRTGPLVAAFADVWRRLAEGADPDWLRLTARHWQWCFDAYAEEAGNRARRRRLGFEEFMELRRRSGFVPAMIDLSQRAHGYELPAALAEHPVPARMLEITSDVVDTVNDVHSLEKEESRGDPHNLVLVIEGERGLDRAAALAEVQRLVAAWTAEFTVLADTLRRRPPAGASPALLARHTEALACAMRGYLEWSRRTERYSHLVPPGEPALTADLLTPPEER